MTKLTPEVLAAAERLKRVDDGEIVNDVYGVTWPSKDREHPYHIDLRRMFGFALALIASQQQEASEREKPIDEEWLRHFNLELVPGFGFVLAEKVFVINSRRGWLIQVYDRMTAAYPIVIVPAPITRGQVLDLLKALGIQAKGGE